MAPDAAQTRQDFKAQQTKHWNGVAAGWASRADWTEQNFAPLTAWLRTSGCWQPGSHVLDVACGSGYPAISAALTVGPSGHVVAGDISPEMLTVAAQRAREAGLTHIEWVEIDAERLLFETGTFDAVTNTYGLMFCADPQQAVGEMRRVLRPGGRAAIAVWDEPAQNPFFELIFTAGASLLALTPPESGGPGPFRLASSERLAALLRGADFSDIAIERVPMTFESESVDDYIQMFGDCALKSRMAQLTVADRASLRAAIADLAMPNVDSHGRLRLQTMTLCAIASA